jgi:hypothetical protein
MEGILLIKTKTTMFTSSSMNGRILSQTAVILQKATVSEPPLFQLPATPSPVAPENTGTEEECTSTEPARIRRLQSTTLQERWNISDPAFNYDSLDITLDFELNEYIASVDQVYATLYDRSCDNLYTGDGLSDSPGSSFDTGVDGDGKHSLGILVSINSDTISADTQAYSEDRVGDQMMAQVDFCLRFALHTPEIAGNVEVNFLETIVTLFVDLTDGFEIGSVSVAPFDRCEFEAAEEFLLEGYFCKEGIEEDMSVNVPVHNQGDLVKICVRPVIDARENFFIRMRRITEFHFERGDIRQNAIVAAEAAPNALTDLWCEPGYAICHFETILFAQFYQSSGFVNGSGFGDMQFGGETSPDSVAPKSRRLLRKNRDLEDAGDAAGPSAEFNMEISIVPVDSVFSAASSSGGLFAMAVAAAAAGAMVLL